MSKATYPHKVTRQLEELEPINSPPLHDQIYDNILVAGLDFRQDRAEECRLGIDLLSKIMMIHQAYTKEAGQFGDIFGEYLECNGETSERNGQFFTPIDLVDMMVQMTLPQGEALVGPPLRILDPSSGTGRFMLRTANYFAMEAKGMMNFLFVNIDIDRRAFAYCTLNAILNGIPSICIHGDTLRMEVWDAFATISPCGGPALWNRVDLDIAKDLMIAGRKKQEESSSIVISHPEPVQATLFGGVV